MIEHTHWYKHTHRRKNVSNAIPDKTQIPVQVAKLIALRDKLEALMSRRVFITGGGFAPGFNGVDLGSSLAPAVKINVSSGQGVPGGWKGKNKR
jgi:hypothetical protein